MSCSPDTNPPRGDATSPGTSNSTSPSLYPNPPARPTNQPEPSLLSTTQPQPHNIFVFRSDMKEISPEEWGNLTGGLLIKQLQQGIQLDLNKSRYNKLRRSHQIQASSEADVTKVFQFLTNNLEGQYKAFCPTSEDSIQKGDLWCMAYFSKSTIPLIDLGLAHQIIVVGANGFSNVMEHLNFPAPPKSLDDGRMSLLYEVSPDLLSYLQKVNFRLVFMGGEIRFRQVSKMRRNAEINDLMSNVSIQD